MEKKRSVMSIPGLGSALFLAVLALGGCSGDSAGVAAYKRGEFSAAYKEFRAEGTPEGDFALGLMYYKGEGVRRDHTEAAHHFRSAAEQGHAGAQYNLGLMYARGEGVNRDRSTAVGWLARSARRGNGQALEKLRVLLADGTWKKEAVN